MKIITNKTKNLFSLFFGIVILGCSNNNEVPIGSEEYISEINEWHANRIESLKKETGWLNLVGLFWLDEGENSFGSANTNKIIFPENAPKKIGTIIKTDSILKFICEPEIIVKSDGVQVKDLELNIDLSGNPTILENGSFRWFIIKRGDKYGIRLRDLDAPLLSEFKSIERFVVNENWKINAKFVPYEKPKEIEVPTILGTVEKELSPGKIEFNFENKNYSLEPVAAGKNLFVIFADLTSGEETYGAGRFLYVTAPDSNNNLILDFNKAYNPPCAFTKYATCPLPPEGNKLRIKITAGEKNYGEGH
ncbi:MAG: DUF1684 domain-containing protein [Ignavibacteriales bacterium]|nr:DUF1684 domain-containing protein [Ignavibacteriales bacterium]